MITRIGKIARLPKSIREQLNERLHEGGQGPELLAWLNALPEVKELLERDFGGKEINGPNLTAWRQGGYADWVAQGQVLELAERLGEEAGELKEQEERIGKPLGELLLTLLTAKYLVAARQPLEGEAGWLRLRELCAELERIRRMEHRERHLRIAEAKLEGQPRQRWQDTTDAGQAALKRRKADFAERVRARLNAQTAVTEREGRPGPPQETKNQPVASPFVSVATPPEKAELSQIKAAEMKPSTLGETRTLAELGVPELLIDPKIQAIQP
ncbi:MAG TPA: hypothetical protein VHH73_06960 [Verrucomicrobiae bacterium]|nr:hypothetical protein [Verrucomicrobiae bacterium]